MTQQDAAPLELGDVSVPDLMGQLEKARETITEARELEREAVESSVSIIAELATRGYQMAVPELQSAVVQGVCSAPVTVTVDGETPVAGEVISQPPIPVLPEEKAPAGRPDTSKDDDMSDEDWAAEIERRAKEVPDTRNAEAIRQEARVPAQEAAQQQESDATQMANGLNLAIAAGMGKGDVFRSNPGVEGYRVG